MLNGIINRRYMLFLVIVLALLLTVILFFQQPSFGAKAAGERLERMEKSVHYAGNSFTNLSYTPALTEGVGYTAVLSEFLFKGNKRGKPGQPLPAKKTILHDLDPNEDVLVWMGHSSYYLQLAGKRILVDPVLSGAASPLSFTTKAFAGTDVYTIADIPTLDYLFITHDHWDHLDHTTVTALERKTAKVVTGLGTGAHLVYWGYAKEKILELDWYESTVLTEELKVVALPARHFSGRSLKRNANLWVSFALLSDRRRVYLGGDSGYDNHFAAIGEAYGPFDLVILECGQYDKSWKYIHMHPSEVLKAATELKAAQLLPVHWAKFKLGNHAWDESVNILLAQYRSSEHPPVTTPMLGELVKIGEPAITHRWWQGLD
jgi:L-ascorbate metabolism protein UlaG (beta-lactamase superfamily)